MGSVAVLRIHRGGGLWPDDDDAGGGESLIAREFEHRGLFIVRCSNTSQSDEERDAGDVVVQQ